ncbi:MAG: hypothetical protein RTU63_11525 [Candidatus Thorarchaeota archaeon]
MPFEEIKREFVSFMEEVRATDPYPRNFMGCLISLIIDTAPVSQERIVELTGYSQATVSMTIQKLKLLMPIRTVRTRGDRRHYYAYEGTPGRFVIDLWQMRLEAQAISYQQLEKMLEKVNKKSSRNKSIKRFQNYLEYFLLVLRVVGELRASGITDFEDELNTEQSSELKNQDVASLNDGEITDFLKKLRDVSFESSAGSARAEQDSKEYLKLKSEYFSEIKTEFNPLFSQEVANQMIVVHSVFLDGYTTQQQIEDVTLLPRSTISEVLKQSINSGLIKVTKKEGSKVKYYRPAISFTDLMLGNFIQLEMHLSQVIPQLVEYRKRVAKIPNSLNQKKPFLNALKSLEQAYAFTRDFSRKMKVEMVTNLKEEIDSGHAFI